MIERQKIRRRIQKKGEREKRRIKNSLLDTYKYIEGVKK